MSTCDGDTSGPGPGVAVYDVIDDAQLIIENATIEDIDGLLRSLASEMPASKAAAEAAKMTGLAKPELYRRLIELKAGRDG